MANNVYCANIISGGGTGALDAIDGAGLLDGDVAFVVDASNNVSYIYTLNATIGGTATSPYLIAPVSNAGNKRWELVKGYVKDSISINDATNIGLVQFASNVLELYSQRHGGSVAIMVEDGSGNKETAVKATGGGSVELYHDNSKKIETASTGVNVTGTVEASTGVTVAGKSAAILSAAPASGDSLIYNGSLWAPAKRPARNLLINGGMMVAQRISVNADVSYRLSACDRWHTFFNSAGGSATTTQASSTSAAASGKVLAISSIASSSSNYLFIGQRMESLNSYPIAAALNDGKKLSLSFRLYHDLAANTDVDCFIYSANATDNFSGTTLRWSSNTTSVSSGSYRDIVINGFSPTVTDLEKGLLLYIRVTIPSSTSGKLVGISAVQLELNDVATPFEVTDFATELTRCQRYYETSYDYGTLPGTTTTNGTSFGVRVNGGTFLQVNYKTRKRTVSNPTIYSPATGTSGQARNYNAAADQAATVGFAGDTSANITVGAASVSDFLGCQWVVSAEL